MTKFSSPHYLWQNYFAVNHASNIPLLHWQFNVKIKLINYCCRLLLFARTKLCNYLKVTFIVYVLCCYLAFKTYPCHNNFTEQFSVSLHISDFNVFIHQLLISNFEVSEFLQNHKKYYLFINKNYSSLNFYLFGKF